MVMKWELSCGMMMQQIGQQVNYAFSQSDLRAQTMYWIGTVGPLWVYRKKDNNRQDPVTLIEWHNVQDNVTHNGHSFQDFLQLQEHAREHVQELVNDP